VLRVNSPGGSVFGSELVRRELELTRAGRQARGGVDGRPGGLGRLLDLDRVRRDHRRPEHVTGSIGVIALLPNFSGTLDKLGVHSTTLATTWLRSAFDPRVPLDPRLADMIQRSVDHEYQSFIARVAQARKTTPDKIDGVAQGRGLVGRAGARARA
jgi:protease-4